MQKQYHIIYILANDNDYLQVCNNNIKLINGLVILYLVIKVNNYYGDKYLLSKILLGDKSDNIKCCTLILVIFVLEYLIIILKM